MVSFYTKNLKKIKKLSSFLLIGKLFFDKIKKIQLYVFKIKRTKSFYLIKKKHFLDKEKKHSFFFVK